MRIAMISTPYVSVPPLEYGGTELVVYELVEGLLDRGHEVTLFATGDSRTRAGLRALYRQPRWPPEPWADANHVSWALAEVLREGYDVIHAHSAVALALGRLVPVPLVYTLHHVQNPDLSDYYRHFTEADIVAISHDQARREVGVRRCTVIHHGIDPGHYEWTPRPDGYVCFVGRFAPEKGLPAAIDAAELGAVPVLVAGETHPGDVDYARAEVEPRLRRRHVRYLGPVGLREKRPLLRDARALLAPIDWNEPFGLILIEALLSGCPVVAYGRGSVPELIDHGVTGFIASGVEDMARLIRPGGPIDRLDRRRIREIAVRRFGRDRMVDEHERLYRRIAGGRMPRHPSSAA